MCSISVIISITPKRMKKLLFIILLLVQTISYSQCVSNQSHAIVPVGPYAPGQVVTVNYTLGAYNGINVNWIHTIQINLGAGWTGLSPITPPANPFGSAGTWMWDLQNTYPSGFNFGPGWRFVNAGNVGWGTVSTGPFTMSFRVTVAQTCTADDLTISIETFDDCVTGGWLNGNCCVDPAYPVYNGVVQIPNIITSNINHY